MAWDRLHPRLTRRSAWAGSGDLPVIAGTVIHLQVDRLPPRATPKPVWLWWSGVHPTATTSPTDVDRLWQTFLRRFDIEHTFRMLKQALGLVVLRRSSSGVTFWLSAVRCRGWRGG
jgi:hypothetical protein